MKLFFRILCLLLCNFFANCLYAFTVQDVVSPVQGVWNNVQPLVLDVEEGSELFYSLTDADPLLSGFAYDGPVVINETGNIKLKIASVSKTGERSDVTVSYTVKKNPYRTLNEDTKKFVADISENPIRKYISGTSFVIPSSFKFCINDNTSHFYQGTALSLSSANKLERYVPITVREGSFAFRFVMNVVSEKVQTLKTKSPPFSIYDWNNISFIDEKYLYQIDNGQWFSSGTETIIDRFFTHTIRWKLVESEVVFSSFVLPPKPQLKSKVTERGSIEFYLKKASNDYTTNTYMMASCASDLSVEKISSGLHTKIEADTFKGDQAQSKLKVNVYYDGVLQGVLDTDFTVDRLPPDKPIIETEKKDSIAQGSASVLIKAETHADIFYAISEPIEINIEDIEKNKTLLDSVAVNYYKLYDGKSIKLSSVLNKTTFYKIIAYAVDENKNISDFTEYKVIVDENNFYLYPKDYFSQSNIKSLTSDINFSNVFYSMEQAVEAINQTKNMCLHILGNIKVNGSYTITSDCTIIGKDCKLQLEEDSYISFVGANIKMQNCSIEKKSTKEKDNKFLVATNANLFFSDCDFLGRFKKNVILVDANSSYIDFKNVGLSVYSLSYANTLSAKNSEIVLYQTRMLSSAKTCVNASISNTKFNSIYSYFFISADDGRCIEFIKTTAELKDNSFFLNKYSKKSKKLNAIWRDADTIFTVEKGNIVNE